MEEMRGPNWDITMELLRKPVLICRIKSLCTKMSKKVKKKRERDKMWLWFLRSSPRAFYLIHTVVDKNILIMLNLLMLVIVS